MNNEESVIKYYVLCNRLKNLIRVGWTLWDVKRERLESVAEHIFGTQSLAIAMCLQYKYDIDLYKVILMLSVHELEEIYIGDLAYFQISKDEKTKLGHEAVKNILSDIIDGNKIEELVLEFDERKTAEAKFCYHVDKLECDLQCKLYDEDGCVSMDNLDNVHDPYLKELADNNSDITWSDLWLTHDEGLYSDDINFAKVLKYAKNNKISEDKIIND